MNIMRTIKNLFILNVLVLWASYVSAINQTDALHRWVEESANRIYYNAEAKLPWENEAGDYLDKYDVFQGSAPYDASLIKDFDKNTLIKLDITSLARKWKSGSLPSLGLFLKGVGNGTIQLSDRKNEWLSFRPRIEILADKKYTLLAVADTHIDHSTLKPMEQKPIKVSDKKFALLAFESDELLHSEAITKATLYLNVEKQWGNLQLQVYAAFPGYLRYKNNNAVEYGRNSQGDTLKPKDIIAQEYFEDENWQELFSETVPQNGLVRVLKPTKNNRLNKALLVTIKKGTNLGINSSIYFRNVLGHEPDSCYFQYKLMLNKSWDSKFGGGKLPGLSGTYNRAGWGGRKSDGINGWSMRGLFVDTIGEKNPLYGRTPIGTYAYHGAMKDFYGDHWFWNKQESFLLEKEKWYVLEQYVKLNDPGVANGKFIAWINGKEVFNRDDILYRNTGELKIEKMWLNVYHGGTAKSQKDQHVFIDDIILSTSYIGLDQK